MQRFATSQWPGALTEPITEFHSGVGTWDDKPRLPLPLRLTLRVIGREVRAALSRWATGRWFSGLWRGDRAELQEQSEVVSGRPVFRDQVIGDPKDVDVLHGVGLARGRRRDQCRALNTDPTVWQRIRRTVRSDPKSAAYSYSADDEFVFRDEVINLPAAAGKGSPKGVEDPPDCIPAPRLLRSVLSSSPASPAPARPRSSKGRFPPMRAWSRSTKARFTAHDGATRPRTPVCSTRSATRLRRPIA